MIMQKYLVCDVFVFVCIFQKSRGGRGTHAARAQEGENALVGHHRVREAKRGGSSHHSSSTSTYFTQRSSALKVRMRAHAHGHLHAYTRARECLRVGAREREREGEVCLGVGEGFLRVS